MIEKGAIIDGTSTLTINGPFGPKPYQVFGSSITIAFGEESVEKVYLQWWKENTTPGTTDMTTAFQSAIDSLPASGGTVWLINTTYKVTSVITFPIGKLKAGFITNITIQGESSGLASGGVADAYGARINSHIAGGALFDLYTSSPICVNVRFKDFEAQDIEGSSVNYGLKAYRFATGSLIENVGFKAFSYGVYISDYAYYSKLDRVAAYYSRTTGMHIVAPNMLKLDNISASNSTTGPGLYIEGSHGVLITGGWFEHNKTYGITLHGSALKETSIIGAYFEGNETAQIHITGSDNTHYSEGGVIIGCYIGTGYSSALSISLGYVDGLTVIGNHLGHYVTNRCVYSLYAKNCTFIGNIYNTTPTNPLSVPTDNMIMETSLGTRTYEEAISTSTALKIFGVSNIDSSGGVLALTLGSAKYIGERKTIVMSAAGNNAVVTVALHNLGDGGAYTYDAVDEAVILEWMGTEWTEIDHKT